MKPRKIYALLLAAALTVGLLAGCSGSSGDSSDADASAEVPSEEETAEAEELSLTVVTTYSANAIAPLVQVAEVEGYFADYNLTINYVPLESSGVFESVSIGKVDTTYGQLIPGLTYGAQGSDVTIFAGTASGGMAAITTAENAEKFSDPENWAGATVGVIQLSTSELVSKYALQNTYGIEDITYTYIDEYANVVLAVQKGTVDVGFVGSQYLEAAEEQGLVKVFSLASLMEDYVCCRQTAYTESIEENRDAYVAYLKAQILAYRVYAEDEDTTVADVVEESSLDESTVISYVYDEESNNEVKYNPDPNYNGTLAVYGILVDSGYVETDIELYEFFDISIYAEALQEIIAENDGDEFYEDMWTYFIEHNDEYPDFAETYES